MNDYSHLRLHDTRTARAALRARHTTQTPRPRDRWRHLLNALRISAHAPRPGAGSESTSATGAAATPDLDTPAISGGHTDVDGTAEVDAHTGRNALRVP